MSEIYYTVGEVSKLTGVPKDTLLHYDRRGLFKPSYINPKTRYRYYTHDQFWTLDIIHCCRNLGIPLKEIQSILESDDNSAIVGVLDEHKKKALELSEYYKNVAENIDWYNEQFNIAQAAVTDGEVSVHYYPERTVVYGEDLVHHWDYHSKFMYSAKEAFAYPESFRRASGFTMNPKGLYINNFMKTGEYAEFTPELMELIDDSKKLIIPAGDYACCTVNVVHRDVDFSILLKWLQERDITPEYVFVEELVFQMFWYFGEGYPCVVKVKIN